MNKLKQFFQQQTFVRYVVTGAAVTVLELWLLYALVSQVHWWYLYASSLSFFVGLVVSFFLRKIIVFKNNLWSAWPRQLFFYSVVWLIDIVFNAGLMYVMVDRFNLDYLLAQIIANIFLGLFGFTCNKFIIFKKFTDTHELQHRQLLEAIRLKNE